MYRHLQRRIEYKLRTMGLLLQKLDILVIRGNVGLTGNFISIYTGQPFSSDELGEMKRLLMRIPEVESVCLRVVDNPVLVS